VRVPYSSSNPVDDSERQESLAGSADALELLDEKPAARPTYQRPMVGS
jgi:hypothetical protein